MMKTRFLAIMCLMSYVFPLLAQEPTVGLFQFEPATAEGYVLFNAGQSSDAYLIDNCGKYIHSWQGNNVPGSSIYLLENGNLLRATRTGMPTSFTSGGTGGRLEILDWDSNLLWEYVYSEDFQYHQHHDVAYMPNGNILILAWEYKSEAEAIAAGRNPLLLLDEELWPEQIVEIEPVGDNGANIVWEWHLWDHLVQQFDPSKENYDVVVLHPELLDINATAGNGADWLHCNSIDYNPELDQILLSSRHLSEIYVIDHSTTTEEAAGHSGGNSGMGGDILYRWGNPIHYKLGGIADQELYAQHDASWIPEGYPDAGKIMVFNNGNSRPQGFYSSVDIITPPMNEMGQYIREELEIFGPDTLHWSYVAEIPEDFYSNFISGARQQPNGNVLICEGSKGHFFEVDEMGNIVWDYLNPINGNGAIEQGSDMQSGLPNGFAGTNTVFRATKYPLDYPAFEGKDLVAGEPLELNPYDYECGIVLGSREIDLEQFEFYPNPVATKLFINAPVSPIAEEMRIIDSVGKTLFFLTSRSDKMEIDISSLENGIYFLSGGTHTVKFIVQH